MYKSSTQSPRQVPVILAESMRPSTALADRDLLQQLQRTESGEARFKESCQMKCEDTLNYIND